MDKDTEALADAASALIAYFDRVGVGRDEGPLIEALRTALAAIEDQNNAVWRAVERPADTCPVCHGYGRADTSWKRCYPCRGTGVYPPPNGD